MIWLGIVVFACTNIDDLFVLVAFFADPSFRPRQIVIGQFLGSVAIISLSLLGALCAVLIPHSHIGLLGLIPLGLGLWKLLATAPTNTPWVAARTLTIAAVTIANGGDNVGAYVPLFSTLQRRELLILVVVQLLMTGAWCALAHALVHAPVAGRWIRRIGSAALPWILIALGVYILVAHRTWLIFG